MPKIHRGPRPRVENSNGKFADENGLKDLVLMGDEVADPDISMLAQQENEFIEDDVIDIAEFRGRCGGI